MNEPIKLLELNIEELTRLKETGIAPDAVIDYEGIQQHPSFAKIFAHRAKPEKIVDILLKDKLKAQHSQAGQAPSTYQPVVSEDVRLRRLELKEKELEIKQTRNLTLTKRLNSFENELKELRAQQKIIVDFLKKIWDNINTSKML